MKRVCSWCGLVMDVGAANDVTITHSICEACIAKIEKQMADRAAKLEKKNKQ